VRIASSGGRHYDVTVKSLHRADLFTWSTFDRERNIDFNSVLWNGGRENVLIDPLPLSGHDRDHLEQLGNAAWIIVTNSDHVRDTAAIAAGLGAKVAGPAAERETFPIACDRWLTTGDEVVAGLTAIEMWGSKTPGELALLLEDSTLITGDLIRAHRAGRLMLLPDAKLADKARALESVQGLLAHDGIDAVLVGDGWSVFRDGRARLLELI
jgi:hypothetical protein